MKVIKIQNKEQKITEIIWRNLEQGKIIVLPTDTVYGLVCDARNERAVKRIFQIKKRLLNKPIGIFVKDIKMAKEVAEISAEHEKLLKTKWPGKFTFILKRQSDKLSRINRDLKFVGTDKTIGIRVPDYELISNIFKKIDFPLAQTSANISGQPASVKINQVLKQFENQAIKPDLVIDAGNLPESDPSTIIDLIGKEPKILR